MALTTDYLGDLRGDVQVITGYQVASGPDTSGTDGVILDNRDGRVSRVAWTMYVDDQTGTSPTLQTTLQGSMDGTTFFNVLDSGGSAIQTTALDISTADSTAVSESEDTNAEGISSFPPFLKLAVTIGGTSTPGWGGSLMVQLTRRNKSEVTLT